MARRRRRRGERQPAESPPQGPTVEAVSAPQPVTRPRKKAKKSAPLSYRLRRWRRPAGVVVALAAVAAGLFFLVNPFAGPPTAIDATGQEVDTGVINTPGASPQRGRPAPNFLLAGYDGRAVRLDDYRGKVVWLNFWATWCPFCAAEMADIKSVAEEFDEDLVVLAINRGEGHGTAKDWSDARKLEPSLKVILDQREDVTGAYRLRGMPTSIFVDRDGTIRQVYSRAMELGEMRDIVRQLVSRPDDTDFHVPEDS